MIVPRRSHPCSKCPCYEHVHAMTKETSLQTSKEITGRKACKRTKYQREPSRGQTNMLLNKRGCLRRTNVGVDQVSIVP